MRLKFVAAGLGITLFLSPLITSAQSSTDTTNASTLDSLNQLIQNLEAQLQQLLALRAGGAGAVRVSNPLLTVTPASGSAPLTVSFSTQRGGVLNFGDGQSVAVQPASCSVVSAIPCPAGYYGSYPNCSINASAQCPTGYSGTYPYCQIDAASSSASCINTQTSHTYAAAGTYTATLTGPGSYACPVFDRTQSQSGCTWSASRTLATVTVAVTGATSSATQLTATPASGTAPLSVSFSSPWGVPVDASGTPATGVNVWIDFGDGSQLPIDCPPSSVPGSACVTPATVTHTYSQAGTYQVSVNSQPVVVNPVTTTLGTVSVAVAGTSTSPTALPVTPASGIAPLTVHAFFESGLSCDDAYDLSWGDGSPDLVMSYAPPGAGAACAMLALMNNPAHTYTAPGTYAIYLKSGTSLQNLRSATVTVSGATSTSAQAPTVTLTQSLDTTTNDGNGNIQPFTISWNSTNATSCTVSRSNPAGQTYVVSRRKRNDSRSLSLVRTGIHHLWIDCTGTGGTAHQDLYHTVARPGATGTSILQASPSSGSAPLWVTFTSQKSVQYGTVGGGVYTLDFGDGSQVDVTCGQGASAAGSCGSPVTLLHSYAAPGTYSAILTYDNPSIPSLNQQSPTQLGAVTVTVTGTSTVTASSASATIDPSSLTFTNGVSFTLAGSAFNVGSLDILLVPASASAGTSYSEASSAAVASMMATVSGNRWASAYMRPSAPLSGTYNVYVYSAATLQLLANATLINSASASGGGAGSCVVTQVYMQRQSDPSLATIRVDAYDLPATVGMAATISGAEYWNYLPFTVLSVSDSKTTLESAQTFSVATADSILQHVSTIVPASMSGSSVSCTNDAN